MDGFAFLHGFCPIAGLQLLGLLLEEKGEERERDLVLPVNGFCLDSMPAWKVRERERERGAFQLLC